MNLIHWVLFLSIPLEFRSEHSYRHKLGQQTGQTVDTRFIMFTILRGHDPKTLRMHLGTISSKGNSLSSRKNYSVQIIDTEKDLEKIHFAENPTSNEIFIALDNKIYKCSDCFSEINDEKSNKEKLFQQFKTFTNSFKIKELKMNQGRYLIAVSSKGKIWYKDLEKLQEIEPEQGVSMPVSKLAAISFKTMLIVDRNNSVHSVPIKEKNKGIKLPCNNGGDEILDLSLISSKGKIYITNQGGLKSFDLESSTEKKICGEKTIENPRVFENGDDVKVYWITNNILSIGSGENCEKSSIHLKMDSQEEIIYTRLFTEIRVRMSEQLNPEKIQKKTSLSKSLGVAILVCFVGCVVPLTILLLMSMMQSQGNGGIADRMRKMKNGANKQETVPKSSAYVSARAHKLDNTNEMHRYQTNSKLGNSQNNRNYNL